MKLSTMVGRQLPFVSVFIPFYVIMIMVGWKKTIEVLPAIIVCGVTFAVAQWGCASYLGPYLPDIIASLATLAALVILLKFWQPKTVWTFDHEPESTGKEPHDYTGGEVFRAWAPYLVLTIMVLIWGIPSIKDVARQEQVVISSPVWTTRSPRTSPKPEDGIKKVDARQGRNRRTAARLPDRCKQAAMAARPTELAAWKIIFVSSSRACPARRRPDRTRDRAFDAMSKKKNEIAKLEKELSLLPLRLQLAVLLWNGRYFSGVCEGPVQGAG